MFTSTAAGLQCLLVQLQVVVGLSCFIAFIAVIAKIPERCLEWHRLFS